MAVEIVTISIYVCIDIVTAYICTYTVYYCFVCRIKAQGLLISLHNTKLEPCVRITR